MANTLFLRLEGPLQSWGERGRWSIRDTAAEPTKSGVIGLLGCALGYSWDGQLRELSENTRMGVRYDQTGVRLTDYHTIGGGSSQPMLLTAQGKPKKSNGRPHTEVSYRDYLCDASFLVALQSDSSLANKLAAALQNPTWVIYLGRKACPPSRPVFDGLGDYDDLQSALTDHMWPPDTDQLSVVVECSAADEGAVRHLDHLVSRSHRVFQPRYTRTITLCSPTDEMEV